MSCNHIRVVLAGPAAAPCSRSTDCIISGALTFLQKSQHAVCQWRIVDHRLSKWFGRYIRMRTNTVLLNKRSLPSSFNRRSRSCKTSEELNKQFATTIKLLEDRRERHVQSAVNVLGSVYTVSTLITEAFMKAFKGYSYQIRSVIVLRQTC